MVRSAVRYLLFLLLATAAAEAEQRPNVLLITVDDMSCDSVGAFGGLVSDATPNIDRLAGEGMRFEHAFVTVAICQPTRAVWMTGRYPHRNGALGFEPIDTGVPTVVAALRAAGYRTGLMAKTGHVIPSRADEFDVVVGARDLRNGREPDLYHRHAAAFLARCADEGRPFFLMANTQDPHRPFAGSRQEERFRSRDAGSRSPHYGGGFPEATVAYTPDQVAVPGFLPDLPEIRAELAEYYTSVQRADRTVGALLRAIDESGLADRTLVIFVSDHGLPMPFAKTNCYRASTRTPWVVRWPGVVANDSVDRTHMISGIDVAPTILDAAGVDPLPGADGRSIVPLLRGVGQTGRERVFTQIDVLSSRRAYPMRAVEEKRYGYIWNGWSNGSRRFRNSSMGGRTWPAIRAAAESDAAIAARVEHFLHRTPEELYDYALDPAARRNLADDPAHAGRLRSMRVALLDHMMATGDPRLQEFSALLDAVTGSSPSEPAPLICCGAEAVFVLDSAAEVGLNEEPPRRWSWRASDSPEIPETAWPLFRTTDECKPVGPYLLVTSSSGGVALIRRADKACVFLARARNAHSACLLPKGRVAVAASTGGDELLVFARSDYHGVGTDPSARLPLAGAHGVSWDAGRRRLWALGDDELLLVRLREAEHDDLTLAVDRRWSLPSKGGHDLSPAGDDGLVWVTTNERVHRFDTLAFGFVDDPVLGNETLVKSVDRHGASVVYHQATRERWWSDTIRFADGTGPIRLPGERLYKVRWDVPAPVPAGH